MSTLTKNAVFMFGVLADGKVHPRKDLVQSSKVGGSMFSKYVKSGDIVKVGKGEYKITKQGVKLAPTPKGKKVSRRDLAIQYMKDHSDKTHFTNSELDQGIRKDNNLPKEKSYRVIQAMDWSKKDRTGFILLVREQINVLDDEGNVVKIGRKNKRRSAYKNHFCTTK